MTKHNTQLFVSCLLSSLVLVAACGSDSDVNESRRPGEEFVIAEEDWSQDADEASSAAFADADLDDEIAVDGDTASVDTAEAIAEEEEVEVDAAARRDGAWGVDDPSDPGIDGAMLGVAVFDAAGHLAALYPAADQGPWTSIDLLAPTIAGVALNQYIAPGQAFKILATNIGRNPGARLTFNESYHVQDSSTWVPISRYGRFPIGSLKVNSLVVKTPPSQRVLESAQLNLDPDAFAHQSLVRANPVCFAAGAGWGAGTYNEGALTLQAVAMGSRGPAFATVPSPDPQSRHGVAIEGVLYEISVFITDYRAACRSFPSP